MSRDSVLSSHDGRCAGAPLWRSGIVWDVLGRSGTFWDVLGRSGTLLLLGRAGTLCSGRYLGRIGTLKRKSVKLSLSLELLLLSLFYFIITTFFFFR